MQIKLRVLDGLSYRDQLLSMLSYAENKTKPFSTKELYKRYKLISILQASDIESTIVVDDDSAQFLYNFLHDFNGWLVVDNNIITFLTDILGNN